MLERRPLMIHQEPRLVALYCPDAGPFSKRSQEFELLLSTAEYRAQPPSRGTASFVFLVAGDRGTGKTTLASHMIEYVLRCTDPGAGQWRILELNLRADAQAPADQIAELATLEQQFTATALTEEDYCCVFIDDVLGPAFPHCLELFDRLAKKAVTFLVVTSSDAQLIAQSRDRMRHTVTVFEIGELSPDSAVAFVRHRLNHFRPNLPVSMAAHPLFPFDEADLRQAVDTGAIVGASNQGPVTIRQFNRVLHDTLVKRLTSLATQQPGFDVLTLSPAVTAEHVINVAEVYRTLVLPP